MSRGRSSRRPPAGSSLFGAEVRLGSGEPQRQPRLRPQTDPGGVRAEVTAGPSRGEPGVCPGAFAPGAPGPSDFPGAGSAPTAADAWARPRGGVAPSPGGGSGRGLESQRGCWSPPAWGGGPSDLRPQAPSCRLPGACEPCGQAPGPAPSPYLRSRSLTPVPGIRGNGGGVRATQSRSAGSGIGENANELPPDVTRIRGLWEEPRCGAWPSLSGGGGTGLPALGCGARPPRPQPGDHRDPRWVRRGPDPPGWVPRALRAPPPRPAGTTLEMLLCSRRLDGMARPGAGLGRRTRRVCPPGREAPPLGGLGRWLPLGHCRSQPAPPRGFAGCRRGRALWHRGVHGPPGMCSPRGTAEGCPPGPGWWAHTLGAPRLGEPSGGFPGQTGLRGAVPTGQVRSGWWQRWLPPLWRPPLSSQGADGAGGLGGPPARDRWAVARPVSSRQGGWSGRCVAPWTHPCC